MNPFVYLTEQFHDSYKPAHLRATAHLNRINTGVANGVYRALKTLWICEMTCIVASSMVPSLRHKTQP